MNIAVKHNGSTVTQYVISYEREHKICTGIGELSITFSSTYPGTFEPWDEIDIYENGSFQVRYYVSHTSFSVPSGTIVLECQDKSKRLVDYFIPESYTIDYPSNTRYWIEKFLDEAGISYQFSTTSQGVLLSNYTNLGLMPGYEQVLQLLQLSGWYMFFDGNGVAKIGSLQTLLSKPKQTFTSTSILQISKDSNDKMLRNRAVVWGAYDILRREYAYADVSTRTRWNYDRNDYRTMVVSNQNIPNKASAVGIANTLLKEFSRITVEKHLSIEGCSNRDLGDMVRVRTSVWSGTGMITTFGVSMSKSGLITNLILDERCPRLYGFFDFGDEVYVGTYGDGIWRKHIKYDPLWRNFSTGLTNLGITDLHINNEVYSAVASSGEMFYTTSEEGPWVQYSIDSLTSSLESQIEGASGIFSSGVVLTTFSGLMARATIVDKLSNVIKYGIDTYSGVNYGDYFMMYSGFTAGSGLLGSGFMAGEGLSYSGYRGWIVEWDPFTSISGVYPISISGNFDIMVIDLENDGLNDYVSVRTGSNVVISHTDLGYNFGKHESQLARLTQDDNAKVSFAPLGTFSSAGKSMHASLGTGSIPAVFDNESIGEREILWFGSGVINRRKIFTNPLSSSSEASPAVSMTGTAVAISKISQDVYRIYFLESGGFGLDPIITKYKEWDADAGTLSGEVISNELQIPENTYHPTTQTIWGTHLVIDGVIYVVVLNEIHNASPSESDPDWDFKADNYIEMYVQTTNIHSGNGSSGMYQRFDFPTAIAFGKNWKVQSLTNDVSAYQNGNTIDVAALVQLTSTTDGYEKKNYLIYSRGGLTFNITGAIQETTSASDPNFLYTVNAKEESQLTGEHFYILYYDSIRDITYFYNGDSLSIESSVTSIPWNFTASNIYGMFGAHDTHHIAKNGTDWYFCNPQTLAPDVQFVPPLDYEITKPYSSTDTISPLYYWQARNAEATRTILQTTKTSVMHECQPDTSFTGSSTSRGFICGNFFVDYLTSIAFLYLDNSTDVPDRAEGYLILQRQGNDFHIIEEASKPMRVDISNSSPVLSVQDVENTFTSNFIFGNELYQVGVTHPFTLTPSGVRDYRYTITDIPSGVVVSSGVLGEDAASKLVLYLVGSGVNYTHADTLFSGFTQMWAIPSGLAERIEVSNYVSSGQFVFVTTSGDSPAFYQKDPMNDYFVSYSGLPVSRATIIRLDDRF